MFRTLWGLKCETWSVTWETGGDDIKRNKGYNKISPDGLQASDSVKAVSIVEGNEGAEAPF